MNSADSVRSCGGRVLTRFWRGRVSFLGKESKDASFRRPYERWLRLEFADHGMKNKRIDGRQPAVIAAKSLTSQVLTSPPDGVL